MPTPTDNRQGDGAHESTVPLRKPYERPRILWTEKLELRSCACNKSDSTTCGAGPLQS